MFNGCLIIFEYLLCTHPYIPFEYSTLNHVLLPFIGLLFVMNGTFDPFNKDAMTRLEEDGFCLTFSDLLLVVTSTKPLLLSVLSLCWSVTSKESCGALVVCMVFFSGGVLLLIN